MHAADVQSDGAQSKREEQQHLSQQDEVDDEPSSASTSRGLLLTNNEVNCQSKERDQPLRSSDAVQDVISDNTKESAKSAHTSELQLGGGKFTDSSGVDLEKFIVLTLHKNLKDRKLLLDLERELTAFLQDSSRRNHRFPPMSSYNRMVLHRVAAFFGLSHNVDGAGTAVVVSKTDYARLPDKRFEEYIRPDEPFDDSKKMPVVLKREPGNSNRRQPTALSPQKTRSFEEREEQYVRIRARIFNQNSTEVLMDSSLPSHSSAWNSADNGSMSTNDRRLAYSMRRLMNLPASTPNAVRYDSDRGPFQRCNNDVENIDSLPHPLPRGRLPDLSSYTLPLGGLPFRPHQQVVYALSSIEQVPVGAMILHPETGQPYRNPDGSIYRHNPVMWQMQASYKNGSLPTAGAYPFRPMGTTAMQAACTTGPLIHSQMQQLNLSVEPGSGTPQLDGMPTIQSPSNMFMNSSAMCAYFVSPNQAPATGQQPPPLVSNHINVNSQSTAAEFQSNQISGINRDGSPQGSSQVNAQNNNLLYPVGCNVYLNMGQPMSNAVPPAPASSVYATDEPALTPDVRYPENQSENRQSVHPTAYLIFNGSIRHFESHSEPMSVPDGVSGGHL